MTDSYTPQGWYVDPTGQGNARYWNGASWTQTVNRAGVVLNVYIDPNQAKIPPTPGTQVAPPVAPPPRPAPPVASPDNSAVGVVIGVVAVLFFALMMFVIISNNSSSNDTPDVTIVQPEPEQPAPEPTAPAVEAPSDTTGG